MSDWKNEIEKRLEASGNSQSMSHEVIREFAAHLEDRYRELVASDLEEGAARAAVLGEIASLEPAPPRLPPSKRARSDREAPAGMPGAGGLLTDFGRDLRN